MEAEILHMLTAASLLSACAIAIAFGVRHALRALFGPNVAYYVWLMVPVVLVAFLLPRHPAPPISLPLIGAALLLLQRVDTLLVSPGALPTTILLITWAVGTCLMLVATLWQQARFVKGLAVVARRNGILYAQHLADGPLVIGIVRPQIVVSLDFEERYTPSEQQVVLAHEHMHVRRGDPMANALCAFLRCVFWFHPLVYLAASRFRLDQELACDEAVIRQHPTSQQSYASAMLKTHLANTELPLACHWPSRHPLKARILMLRKAPPCRARRTLGALITSLAVITIGYGAWAAQPGHSGAPTSPGSEAALGGTSLDSARDQRGALLAHSDGSARSCFWVPLRPHESTMLFRPSGGRTASLAVLALARRAPDVRRPYLAAEFGQLPVVFTCRRVSSPQSRGPPLLTV